MNIISPCHIPVILEVGNGEREETRMERSHDILIVNTVIGEGCNVTWRFC